MNILAQVLIGLVAAEHLYILWLEMFAWETKGRKVFKGSLPDDLFKPTKTLAANQGLYNGFLAAGLIWTLFIEDHHWKLYVAVFFLTCIIIAGIYGAITAHRKIFFVQAVPALIALVAVHLPSF
jgi:putative membrane protein